VVQVQTLMSVDADRVVTMVASLHELWSLPLQIVVALVLLYTQVRGMFIFVRFFIKESRFLFV